ncbi:type II toxin-antitoxin system VapC family toxin [Trinickia acidisoli]|uniref:type II toxin-antitoxin system VapC family toxin n=1 Tax=Trinickia acidisoli TaxID=2767482 RepID=UPI001A8E29D2|nr:type II toxin-antitoxin system VapC family toxin [Trinickia acidisoli]
MVKALFDTNILIDYLSGVGAAKKELARYEYRAVSIVTWMEVLVGTTANDEAAIRTWLSSFEVIALNSSIASRAVEIRKQRRIRLPDAIVWASADVNSLLLVSRNTKDFPADEPGVRVPYKVWKPGYRNPGVEA